jgi:hypothetical protein
MNATLLYRIAAVLLLIFAAGHTVGFLHFKPPTPEGVAVREAMDRVQFHVRGAAYSLGGFYVGFGLYVGLGLLFSAFLALHLGGLAATNPRAIGAIGWIFCLQQAGGLVLSWFYFSTVPVIFSVLVTICTGGGAWLARPR